MNPPAKTTWLVHGLFVLCAALILGAMASLTRGVFSTERERVRTEERAAVQERFRLALWRLDAAAAAWIADEAQHPVTTDPRPERRTGVILRFEAREDGAIPADDPERVPALREKLGLPAGSNAFTSLCSGVPELPGVWSATLPKPAKADPKADARLAPRDSVYQQIADTAELRNRGRAVKGAVEKSQAQFHSNYAIPERNAPPNGVSSGRPCPDPLGSPATSFSSVICNGPARTVPP